MILSAILAAATVSLTPSLAVEQARVMILYAAGEASQPQFRGVRLRRLGSDMLFCGKVNTRAPDGSLSGWQDVVIVVSGNPNARVVITGGLPYQRQLIVESCRHGQQVDARDYSAALSPGF